MRSKYILKNASIFLIFTLAIFADNAFCRDLTEQKLETSVDSDSSHSPSHLMKPSSPWNLFAGVGGGYNRVFGSDFNQSLTGSQVLLSGLVSYETYRWVFDGGASWLYSRLSGLDSADREVRMRTRSGTIDLSPRYRITKHWQLGPSFNIAFGTDTSFSPRVGDSSGNYFVGLRSVYETNLAKFPFRFWQQVSTDISISNRQSLLAMVGVQIGLPLNSKQSPKLPVISVEKPNEDVNIVLDSQLVFFGTNSSKIRPEVKAALQNLAQYLRTDESNWSFVEISGHADQRGQFDYNLKLSKQRALAVRDAIELDQSTKQKIKVEAYSYLKPVDGRNNPRAWAKNRRVEITFHEVKDSKTLTEKLEPLTKLTTPLLKPSNQMRPYTNN